MIVGRGLLASAFAAEFADCPEWVIYASGVSNSSDVSQEDFDRERRLLQSWLERPESRLVYFSSCGLAGGDAVDTPYMKHKKKMEDMVLEVKGTTVFRLPQVVGKTGNPHTLMNYLWKKIISGDHFEIWGNAERNIIDAVDVAAIATEILRRTKPQARIINIAAEKSTSMIDLVESMERVLGRRGNYSLIAKGLPLSIDSSLAVSVAIKLGINLSDDYLERTIKKYYGGEGCADLFLASPHNHPLRLS